VQGRPFVLLHHPDVHAIVSVSLSHVQGIAAAMAIAMRIDEAEFSTGRKNASD
jgi:hypothetical protein